MSNAPKRSDFFYANNRLNTVMEANKAITIFRQTGFAMAELATNSSSALLATDQAGSVLAAQSPDEQP